MDAALAHLLQRGLATRDGPSRRLTDRGHTEREAIEADTNERAAPPWTTLSQPEREAVLHGLARLPD